MQFLRFLSLVFASTAASVLAFSAGDDSLPPHRDGVVLMKFQPSISQAQQDAILSSLGASVIKRVGVGVNVVNVGSGRVFGALQSLKARHEVLYAEPDFKTSPLDDVPDINRRENSGSANTIFDQTPTDQRLTAQAQGALTSALPNDVYIGEQWGVQNTGQTVNGTSGAAGADERLPATWSITTGTNAVVVAVLDTGVQYSHPDLLTNMWNNPGGIGGCAAGTHGYNVLTSVCDPMDDDAAYGGHGSHVAGILGAVGNNAAGVAGVNWTANIMARQMGSQQRQRVHKRSY